MIIESRIAWEENLSSVGYHINQNKARALIFMLVRFILLTYIAELHI